MARRSKTNVSCKIGDAVVDVSGTFYPGCAGSYYDPPEGDLFEIDSVEYRNRDITEKLNAAACDRLADKCAEACADDGYDGE